MSPKVMHDDLYPAVVLFISYEAHQLPRTVVLAYLFYISLPAKFLHQKQTLLFIVVVRNQNCNALVGPISGIIMWPA